MVKRRPTIISRRLGHPASVAGSKGKHYARYVDKIRETRPCGDDLLAKVAHLNDKDRAIVSFSGGKDSVATSLYLMRHYQEIVPFFMYIMPGMSFVEETMDYYERHLFKRKIRQVPHPGFWRWVRSFLYADPTQATVVSMFDIPKLTILDIEEMLRESEGLKATAMVATGVRADDSPMRMMSIKRHGPVTMSKKKWHPIWDWTKRDVVDRIEKAGLKLSAEYDWMPRSFSGIHAGYLLPIKKHSPKDYRKILEFMPLIEAECWRYESMPLPLVQASAH